MKNLKDAFTRACRKRAEYFRGSGRPSGKVPTCQHFDLLLFMKDSVSNKSNKASNYSSQESDFSQSEVNSSSTLNLPSPIFEYNCVSTQSSPFGLLSPPAGLQSPTRIVQSSTSGLPNPLTALQNTPNWHYST